MPIRCEVVTQDRALYEGEVDMVVAPGTEGEMGILPNHAPLLTTLGFGVLRIKHRDGEEIFAIAGGILEVRPEVVTVLADVGEHIEEIDQARAEEARRRAEELLASGPPPDTDEYLRIQAALRRSTLRLDAIKRYRRTSRSSPQSRPSEEN